MAVNYNALYGNKMTAQISDLSVNDDIYKEKKLCVVNSIKMRGKCVIYDKKLVQIRLKLEKV